ncbi:MAG: glycosyl transferase [Alphaproteobacteria bacterium CG_4_10_14_0_2_um_filter_63_37]|nr:MAG: glycosyl transferase [Proteobacteria bacterium CG1_02_64_396]PJA25449.1 MAG: glycosyl transferase [Alphaproteobacteria bacterium CG_4_10_14_0_2_um_filter_63_37]
MKQQVSVVLPAYNEAGHIGGVIGRLRSILPDAEFVLVDDGSEDETASAATKAGARVVRHPYNKGNGASVRTGIRAATGDIVVMMDADGQHDPAEIFKLLEHIESYDLVIGARTKESQAGIQRSLGNAFLNRFASWLTGFPVQDLTSGFRAFRREAVLPFLHLFPNRYSYPTTSTLAFLKAGLNVHYVPITVRPRQGGKSNIKVARDGARFLLIIVKLITLFSPMKVFLPVAFAFGGIGLGYSLFTLWHGHFTNMGALLISLGVIVFLMGLLAEMLSSLFTQRHND